ncbi:MAG: BTAD domain-containing putative transcriptional regulator [Solirubrobacteraceae bacterium]
MRFGILGPFEVADDEGRELALGGHKQRAVLAILLLHAGEVVSSDRLIEELWGARAPATAAKTIQIYVSKLRKALGDGMVLTRAGGYVLDTYRTDVDARQFDTLTTEGRGLLHAGDFRGAARLLREALELWRGPALADFGYESFAQATVAQLEESRLVVLEDRIEAELRLGDHAQVVGELEALVREHPLRERPVGQLMLALYRSGRQADALEVYQRARIRLSEELGLEPGPALKAMQADVLEQASALQYEAMGRVRASRQAVGGVPRPATPMIGRERELADITAFLRGNDLGLVTVTGPGGVGKTRLALAVSQMMESEFADGVRWAELAGVGRPQDVGPTLIRVIDATPVGAEDARQTLCRHLAEKELLLVVDNFEHVLPAATLVGELIASCPRLTVLATSREPLNLLSEHQYAVEPLPLPARPDQASVGEIESTSGTALFVAAARRHDHSFALTAATAPVVAELCARLDGLPLALELAAARIGVLTIEQLAVRLGDALSALGPGARDAPERHQTLRATIEWSYRLLTADEQRAFIRFTVFAGGATLEAAEAITGASLETLEALRTKSLLRRQDEPAMGRITMLDTLRRFALETIDPAFHLEETRRRHCEFYLQLVRDSVQQLWTPGEATVLEIMNAEIHNVRGAMRWALAADSGRALELAALTGDYWSVLRDPEGLPWIDAALAAAGGNASLADRARAQLRRASQLSLRLQNHAAIDAAALAVELYRECGDEAGMANAYCSLALSHARVGQSSEAHADAKAACAHARAAGGGAVLGHALTRLATVVPRAERPPVVEEAARLLSEARDYRGLAEVYLNAAFASIVEGHPEEALPLLDLSLPAADELTTPASRMFVLGNLGLANLMLGNRTDAHQAFVGQLRLCVGQAFRFGADEGLIGLAAVFVAEGRLERAAQLFGAATNMGYPGPDPGDQVVFARLERDYFAAARSKLGAPAWDHLATAGSALSYEQAIDFALAAPDDLEHVPVTAET